MWKNYDFLKFFKENKFAKKCGKSSVGNDGIVEKIVLTVCVNWKSIETVLHHLRIKSRL